MDREIDTGCAEYLGGAIAEVRRLRDALRWYADERHYEWDVEGDELPVIVDDGGRARKALRGDHD